MRGRPERRLDSIEEALDAVRAVEGHLVGAPWQEWKPAGNPKLRDDAARRIMLKLEHSPDRESPQNLRDRGVVALLRGRVEVAIAELSRATELAPENGAFWNDLAVARLERARSATDPYELFLALTAAHRAFRQAPHLPAARFNRALALEKLGLRGRAAEDWALVTDHGPDRRWAREAWEHRVALERAAVPAWAAELAAVEAAVTAGRLEAVRATVARSKQKFRIHVEEDLLPRWAVARARRQADEAARLLDRARSIAAALAASGGDRLAADTIAQIDRLSATDPAGLRRLTAGLVDASRGLDLAREDWSRALAWFRLARQKLRREKSPFAFWASYQIALCHYQLSQYTPARSELATLAEELDGRSYEALRGHALHLTGLIDGIKGKQSTSAKALKAALVAFDDSQERPAAAKARGTLAIDLATLGRLDEAWRELGPALVEPTSFAMPELRGRLYTNASTLAEEHGEIEIAFWFRDEAVREFGLAGRQDGLAGAFCKRASLRAALGQREEAARDLAEARQALARIPDPDTRRTLEGDVLLAEAELATLQSPYEAIRKLDAAISVFQGTSYSYRIGHALYLRALAALTLGKHDDVERDLRAAIGELERQRGTITAPGDRISYLDRLKEIFDTMIVFQLEQRQRADVALEYSEQAKARALRDWMQAGPSHGSGQADLPSIPPRLSPSSLASNLPDGLAMVEYTVLPQKTLIWVLRRDGKPQFATADVGIETLDHLVQQLHSAVDRRSARLDTISEQLHDLLISPIGGFLVRGERLVLVPDRALHRLPFCLLRDRLTGRYLMEDHVLTMAPSGRVFAASRKRDLELARQPANRALVIAAPDFDRDLNPSLQQLSSENEAAIARVLAARVLQGRSATRKAFLREGGKFGIIHFGGHSVINPEFPLLSKVLLAPSPGDPHRGVLFADDILTRRFPRTRLVVLASCATATGRLSRTEGVESLARPFLAVGVPSVIASLWDVDDRATADFFTRFYRHLANGNDIGRALQAAQIDFLGRGSENADPKVWAAFELIGSDGPSALGAATRK